jgi:hypothetical protein
LREAHWKGILRRERFEGGISEEQRQMDAIRQNIKEETRKQEEARKKADAAKVRNAKERVKDVLCKEAEFLKKKAQEKMLLEANAAKEVLRQRFQVRRTSQVMYWRYIGYIYEIVYGIL